MNKNLYVFLFNQEQKSAHTLYVFFFISVVHKVARFDCIYIESFLYIYIRVLNNNK